VIEDKDLVLIVYNVFVFILMILTNGPHCITEGMGNQFSHSIYSFLAPNSYVTTFIQANQLFCCNQFNSFNTPTPLFPFD